MYVVTFYSFKGGVGCSMALVNVGLELARRGRRVLLVDFDLEAPGLDTFPLLRPKAPTKGIVDFVSEFENTGNSPDIKDFVYQVDPQPSVAGSVIVMPTGLPDGDYGSRLNGLDWQRLYSERDGFLLFEDLKEQWRRSIQPDYVLIDSRTGHTDVGGICTRQLPDAVALLFFPNEQNERGMRTVVEDIRAEKNRTGKEIALHFVASNVPDLDDEDRILLQRIRQIKQSLECSDLEMIHHYDSMALLDQRIFTVERPKSKLAAEYRRLTLRVVGENFEDRDVAQRHLDRMMRRPGYRILPAEVEVLKKIHRIHLLDGEMLDHIARVNSVIGREEEAENLVAEAQKLGYESEETLLSRLFESCQAGEIPTARKTTLTILARPRGKFFTLEKVISATVAHDPSFLPALADVLNKGALNPQIRGHLAKQMTATIEGAAAAELLLRPVSKSDREFLNDLILALIAQSKFQEAMAMISKNRADLLQGEIADAFNYAIAEWGATGIPPRDLFTRVAELRIDRADPNYAQCQAMAFWAIGDIGEANKQAALALERLDDYDPIFSCWSYLLVEPRVFREDIAAMKYLIDTNIGLPEVISRKAQTS